MAGSLEVVCGSMFSGKTEELIRRLNRAKIAKQSVIVFKPVIDNRYAELAIASHKGSQLEAIPVPSTNQILDIALGKYQVVGIDEAQFFDAKAIVYTCETLANSGIRVIVAGLDQDSFGKPFGGMAELLVAADEITKLRAICVKCGDLASKTYRTTKNPRLIAVGGSDSYEARCRDCWAKDEEKESTLPGF